MRVQAIQDDGGKQMSEAIEPSPYLDILALIGPGAEERYEALLLKEKLEAERQREAELAKAMNNVIAIDFRAGRRA